MEEKSLATWDEFQHALLKMEAEIAAERTSRWDYPLFRGQGDSTLHLESTLDRIENGMNTESYDEIIKAIHKDVATVTGVEWELHSVVKVMDYPLQAYEFKAYLRHNGFPSPLLDWTRSPYVAAFFAFGNVPREAKQVSIYVYREWCGGGNACARDKPRILTLGPTIATHRNHYLQQSQYSICIRKIGDSWLYASYEDVKAPEGQDIVIKYNIPTSERHKVLRKLDSMNITAYSLFNSEPSLMETLWLREFFLAERRGRSMAGVFRPNS